MVSKINILPVFKQTFLAEKACGWCGRADPARCRSLSEYHFVAALQASCSRRAGGRLRFYI